MYYREVLYVMYGASLLYFLFVRDFGDSQENAIFVSIIIRTFSIFFQSVKL